MITTNNQVQLSVFAVVHDHCKKSSIEPDYCLTSFGIIIVIEGKLLSIIHESNMSNPLSQPCRPRRTVWQTYHTDKLDIEHTSAACSHSPTHATLHLQSKVTLIAHLVNYIWARVKLNASTGMFIAFHIPKGHLRRWVHWIEAISHFQTGLGSVPMKDCHFCNQAPLVTQSQGMVVLAYGIIVLPLLQTLVSN